MSPIERTEVKQSNDFFMSTLTNNIMKSRRKKLVPKDKFERHMKRARVRDVECRKHIFDTQSNISAERDRLRQSIVGSIY